MLMVLVFQIKAICVWKEFSCICFVLSIIGDQQIKGFELACYTKIDITEKLLFTRYCVRNNTTKFKYLYM